MVMHMAAEDGQARTALLLARDEAESHSQRGRASPLVRLPGPKLLPGTQHPEGPVTPFTPFPNENGQKRGSPATLCVLPVKGMDYALMGPSQVPHWPGP